MARIRPRRRGAGIEVLRRRRRRAHLPGMVADQTMMPVLGVPVQSQSLNGLDSMIRSPVPYGGPVGRSPSARRGGESAILAVRLLPHPPGAGARLDASSTARRAGYAPTRRERADMPGATSAWAAAARSMFAIAASAGLRSTFLPKRTPTGRCRREVMGLRRPRRGARLSQRVDVVTFEFENVSSARRRAAPSTRGRPAARLQTTQNPGARRRSRQRNGSRRTLRRGP